MVLNLQTPGVYAVEHDAFPNSIVAVPTAIPAFIGYTPRASYRGKSYLNTPVRIESMAEYLAYFGAVSSTSTLAQPDYLGPSGQYAPQYSLVPTTGPADIELAGKAYLLVPDPGTVYYTYNAIRLYFMNGGGAAYVCSVGPYGQPTRKGQEPGKPLVNGNVSIKELTAGLEAVARETEPTILLCPDANLLPAGENATFMTAMIGQAATTQSRVALLDVALGMNPDPLQWRNEITKFRASVGMNNLKFAVAYYPYLHTTVSSRGDVNFLNLGGAAVLQKTLPDVAQPAVTQVLGEISALPPAAEPGDIQQRNQALLASSGDYTLLYELLLEKVNVLPPSAAMAGIYAATDAEFGVWKAPANVSVNGATGTTLNITDGDQAALNVDPATGKSINAIRPFRGKGVLVWGARTLDGNSLDWRYVNVRRTMIMIEQSIKLAAAAYVFEANDANTWTAISAMISNFLSDLWVQGALAGAKPADAYAVDVGLGSTMTALDILNGRMNISVRVAITHPAEFIVLTFSQMMQKS